MIGEYNFSDIFGNNQATVGVFSANIIAIICTGYNKFSSTSYITGPTFAFSTVAFTTVGYIYAQAVNVYRLNITAFWWQSTVITVILHLLFVGMLFALSFSKTIEQSKKIYI